LTTDTRFVDDAVQDALLLARHKWTVLRNLKKPEAWLTKVALRLLRRRQARDAARYQPLVGDLVEAPRGVHSLCDAVAEQQDLYDAIRQLTPRQGECIVLHYLLDHSVADIAEILAINEGTVKAHLHNGRRRLEEVLGANGDANEGGAQ
jgi:RNA polymerase sigma-70 factor (ECF subfamily)